jgi:hypothetical protein
MGLSANGMAVSSSVCPSGAALATASVAITVLPPGLFSTMTGCFHFSDRRWPTRRACMSVAPPGG